MIRMESQGLVNLSFSWLTLSWGYIQTNKFVNDKQITTAITVTITLKNTDNNNKVA